jgi:hypothetical protein
MFIAYNISGDINTAVAVMLSPRHDVRCSQETGRICQQKVSI